jgi:glutamyl-tRNA synthetase
MIPEGMINYLSLLGWSLSADNDVFSKEELIAAFDPRDVLANPARFDLKKCTAINAEQIRRLDLEDFTRRLVPYLHGSVVAKYVNGDANAVAEGETKLRIHTPLVSADNFDDLTAREQEIIMKAAPLIQERIQLLGESRGMLKFLLDTSVPQIEADAQKQLDKVPDWQNVIKQALTVLEGIDEENWSADILHAKLEDLLVHQLELKPRFAYTPLRVATSGRRVSPPLFESLEILGKACTLERLYAII